MSTPDDQAAQPPFNVEYFEHVVAQRRHEEAGRLLLDLLKRIDFHYGNIPATFFGKGYGTFTSKEDLLRHVFTRLASAISTLFSDPNFQWSPQGFAEAMPLQRWLGVLFANTDFGSADHVIRSLNNMGWQSDRQQWRREDLLKLAFLTVPDSTIPMDLDAMWAAVPQVTATMCLTWLSPRLLGSRAAHQKREVLLRWLPEKLAQLRFEDLPVAILHDAYMHCSYAMEPERHRIKRVIHELTHDWLERQGLGDVPLAEPRGRVDGKPVMLVLLEWFNANHSVYRTHSSSLRAAREKFHLVGVGGDAAVDQAGRDVFHEFHVLPKTNLPDQIRLMRQLALDLKPAVLYMPAVGMSLTTIVTASIRLAPLQLAALGHGASTNSPWVDYFALDEDYIGDPGTFTEKIIRLPVDGMPFVPSGQLDRSQPLPPIRSHPDKVRIAVAATTIKLNPVFLDALARVVATAHTPVEFHFLVGFGTELVWPLVRKMVREHLGDAAVVHQHLPYPAYMKQLSECDMYITPFPYGNMNGIADAATLGIAGVCKKGAHVHEHIDVGLFRRLGLPEWTIAETIDDYVAAVVKMVDDHELRGELRRQLVATGSVRSFYVGRPHLLADRLLELSATAPSR